MCGPNYRLITKINLTIGTENEILVQALPILEKEILIPNYTFCNHTYIGFHI